MKFQISKQRIEQIYNANRYLLDDTRDFEELFDELKKEYTEEELEYGYTIISDKKGHGATRIKAISELGRCYTDEQAKDCAKKDGLKIIEDVSFTKHHRAFYIDNDKNRELLKDCFVIM